MSNPNDEVVFINSLDKFDSRVDIKNLEFESRRARIAYEMTRNLAIAMGEDGGEDTAGRQRIKMMAPADVAKRACDIADSLVAEFDRRGWLVPIPVSVPRAKDAEEARN